MKIRMGAWLVLAALAGLSSGCSKPDEPAATPADAGAPGSAQQAATPAPTDIAPLPPEMLARLVRPNSPVLGRADAPVTIVEFLDPACEACRAFAPVVKQILFLYGNDVRVVLRFAAFHRGSDEAVRALEAARKQHKFEELLTALFERQEQWAAHTGPKPEQVWQIAAELGVNVVKARRDGSSAATDAFLKQEEADITELKVDRTPTFFVNGKPLPSYGVQPLIDLVTREVQGAREAKPAP